MSTAIKNALLRAASNELSNQPVVKRLLQELIDNIAGIGPGGGGTAGLSTCLFVDPAAPGPGTRSIASLELPNRFPGTLAGIQAALNAALPGDAVVLSPGTYDLGSGQIVWPNVIGVNFFALDGTTTLKNDGSTPLIAGTPTVDGFTGSISNMRIAGAAKSDVLVLDRTGALGIQPTGFMFTDVGFTGDARLSLFGDVTHTQSYIVNADSGEASQQYFVNVDFVRLRDADFGPSDLNVDHTGPCQVTSTGSTGGILQVGESANILADVFVDRASSFVSFGVNLRDASSVSAHGNLGIVVAVLTDFSGTFDMGGSQWSLLSATGTPFASRFQISARGCSASNGGADVLIAVDGNVDLDIKGLAGFICAENMSCTTGGTIDRDYVDFEVNSISEELPPGSGIYNWLLDFPALAPASFPTSLGTDLGNWTAVVMPTDEPTANGGIFMFSVDCTVVPNVFQFQAQGAGALAFGTMGARVRMLRRCAPPALA
jgi:hypothetical protein